MIKIKFYGLGYNNYYQAYIKIYDINNNLIYEGKTDNNEINVLLKKYSFYRLCAKTCNDSLNVIFYTNQEEFIFIFNKSIIARTITFLLTDYYYKNLKIERGELIIWPKM